MSMKKNTTSAPSAAAKQSMSLDDIVSELLDARERLKAAKDDEAEFRTLLAQFPATDNGWIHSKLKVGFKQTEYERTPGFDFTEFKKAEPALYATLVSEEMVPELNQEAVEAAVEADPALLAKLQNYVLPGTKVKRLDQVKVDDN